jgi:hypothetical protein
MAIWKFLALASGAVTFWDLTQSLTPASKCSGMGIRFRGIVDEFQTGPGPGDPWDGHPAAPCARAKAKRVSNAHGSRPKAAINAAFWKAGIAQVHLLIGAGGIGLASVCRSPLRPCRSSDVEDTWGPGTSGRDFRGSAWYVVDTLPRADAEPASPSHDCRLDGVRPAVARLRTIRSSKVYCAQRRSQSVPCHAHRCGQSC